MAYTQADLDAVKRARLDLVLGKRVESIAIGNDSFTFSSNVTDRELSRLQTIIEIDLEPDYNPMATAINGGRG